MREGAEAEGRGERVAAIPTCAAQRQLLNDYQVATQEFSRQLTVLNQRMGISPRADYEALRRDVEQARLDSEQARLALERHVSEHGC